jgi:hypothetical protein
MSAWVLFKDKVPEKSNMFGFWISGILRNEWVSSMKPNQWKWVSIVQKIRTGGDSRYLYTFSSIEEPFEIIITGMKLEIFDN